MSEDSKKKRIKWEPLLHRAAEIVESYDTRVTLRQLFYQLVALLLLPNTKSAYSSLSSYTATARRAGWFPDLIDPTRVIHEYTTFLNPGQARSWLKEIYRLDRTEGQKWSVYLGVEKKGIVEQLDLWFGDPLGLPILALGGYSSQTYADEVSGHVRKQDRPAILIYAGDLDATGVDVDRDFAERTSCFDEIRRIALNEEQVKEYNLPPQMGKATDSRAAGFIERYGELIQVELDALAPDVLQGLYRDAIEEFFDMALCEDVKRREANEREELED